MIQARVKQERQIQVKEIVYPEVQTNVLQIFSTICQVRHDALNSPN